MSGRVFVMYGQGGIVTSYGMYLLSQRIQKQWPQATVTNHSWDNPGAIQALARDWEKANPNQPIILIGYSLGANCVTWVSQNLGLTVDLTVCYDPSVLSIVTNPTLNVKRLLLYHNNDIEPEGHAVFVGPMVETTQINMFHLAICYSEMLHEKTLTAMKLVLG